MLEKVIEEINKQGESFEKHTNQWNVMQQLIDILSFQPDCAEVVLQDLNIKEMGLSALVKKITAKRLADPVKVMEEICKFYSIPCPDILPLEVWRNASDVKKSPVKTLSEPLSLLDLM